MIGPGIPIAPEWASGEAWRPTRASDQWQVAAMCFTALAGESPPKTDVPFEVTFPQSGALGFFCKLHAVQGMSGELRVVQ